MVEQDILNQYAQLPQTYSTPPVNYGITEQKSISLISELSPTQDLRNIMKELDGFIWDQKSGRYIQVEGVTPFLNARGRTIFYQFATATLSPINTFSNYRTDKEIIHRLILMQIKKATINFHINWEDYGIQSKTDINIITDKLMILGLSCFYKALGAGDRGAATRNISESINRSSLDRPQEANHMRKQGMFERWRGR